jgi:pantothenate kinase
MRGIAVQSVDQSLDQLVTRAQALAVSGRRTILGITGAPGAGKSTVAEALLAGLGDLAVLVPMDGYHLANEVLLDLGRRDRKGAPDTFDAAGYVALLERLRDQRDDVVYAPRFLREIEEPIANSIAVHRSTRLIITEGNYLLVDDGDFARVRPLLDEAWFLVPDDSVRQERLIARHMSYGKDPEAARAWALGTDEVNARLVAATASRADHVIRVI